MDFLKELIDVTKNEYASIVSDGIAAGDVSGYVGTGSYLFNGFLSGTLFGGLPGNKITAIGGPTSTGKTYIAMDVLKGFLDENPEGMGVYFESESAISKQMFLNRGIDISRVLILPVSTVQQWRFQTLKVLEHYEKTAKKNRQPLFMVIDSLGGLSTTKEMEDSSAGKETVDMTRAKIMKAAGRVITLKMGLLNVPLLATNHTYSTQELYSKQVMGGGTSMYYIASTIIILSKRQDKEGDDRVGNIITCTMDKGRLTKEKTKCEIQLSYTDGLNKYHGLIELGEKYEIIKRIGNRYEFPNGEKDFLKRIKQEPEKFFDQKVMLMLDEACKKEYLYGKATTEETTEEEDFDGEEEINPEE